MFASLSGTVLSKQDRTLILDIHGVGYMLNVARSSLENISVGESLRFFVHTNVREDDISLYGFRTEQEWQLFRLLLVGPKSAREILNAPIGRVRQAIAAKDVAFLTSIRGIGRKTAERIMIDLEGKVKEEISLESAAGSESGAQPAKEDLIDALVSLGYQRQRVLEGLKKIPREISGDEAIIKYFLQNA
ncbi:Holliday junction branch migration protein RuvA [Candidatus Peregrinibacteria bacterium]|nr:Holliday junction branch migration protein RuvA [Candidatus Peregrinibacteria bacterium]